MIPTEVTVAVSRTAFGKAFPLWANDGRDKILRSCLESAVYRLQRKLKFGGSLMSICVPIYLYAKNPRALLSISPFPIKSFSDTADRRNKCRARCQLNLG